jgi:hypothetical protein
MSKFQKGLQNQELVIPVYIDTNALLDLIASIEDGFSLVEKVTSRNTVRKPPINLCRVNSGLPMCLISLR